MPIISTAVPAGRFVKDDGTRPIKDGTLMDVEEEMEQVCYHLQHDTNIELLFVGSRMGLGIN